MTPKDDTEGAFAFGGVLIAVALIDHSIGLFLLALVFPALAIAFYYEDRQVERSRARRRASLRAPK